MAADGMMRTAMQIEVNGMAEEVPRNASIALVIDYLHEGDPVLIVEHNGRYVHPREYGTTQVFEGDRLEFIHPDFGG